jgi:hypothetical protein
MIIQVSVGALGVTQFEAGVVLETKKQVVVLVVVLMNVLKVKIGTVVRAVALKGGASV